MYFTALWHVCVCGLTCAAVSSTTQLEVVTCNWLIVRCCSTVTKLVKEHKATGSGELQQVASVVAGLHEALLAQSFAPPTLVLVPLQQVAAWSTHHILQMAGFMQHCSLKCVDLFKFKCLEPRLQHCGKHSSLSGQATRSHRAPPANPGSNAHACTPARVRQVSPRLHAGTETPCRMHGTCSTSATGRPSTHTCKVPLVPAGCQCHAPQVLRPRLKHTARPTV